MDFQRALEGELEGTSIVLAVERNGKGGGLGVKAVKLPLRSLAMEGVDQ